MVAPRTQRGRAGFSAHAQRGIRSRTLQPGCVVSDFVRSRVCGRDRRVSRLDHV
jgi:hypothetical protein